MVNKVIPPAERKELWENLEDYKKLIDVLIQNDFVAPIQNQIPFTEDMIKSLEDKTEGAINQIVELLNFQRLEMMESFIDEGSLPSNHELQDGIS